MTEGEIKTVVRGWLDGVVIEAYRQDVGWTEIPTSIHPPCSDALFSEGWTFRLKPARKYIPHTKETAPPVWEGDGFSKIHHTPNKGPCVVCMDGGWATHYDFRHLFKHHKDADGNPYGQLVEGGEG